MTKKLSLPFGILATINVMFGTGVLINMVNLIKISSFWGFSAYIFVALLLSPLLYSFTLLLTYYPEGGFYTFARANLGSLWAFISTWVYFTSKLASATLLIHVFSLFFLRATHASINPFLLDLIILMAFMWVNYYGAKTGTWLTATFITLKIIPVSFIIFMSFFCYQSWAHPTSLPPLSEILTTIPLVLYAFVGFEAACSLSLALENPAKNARKVLWVSFLVTVLLTIILQMSIYFLIGQEALKLNTFIDAFNLVVAHIPASALVQQTISTFLYLVSGCAALGGSYGILLSNNWNLYQLVKHKHIPYHDFFY